MPKRPPTKPTTPRLSETARHVVVPRGATSTGWPAVCDKCADFGVRFRPWQDAAGRLILAKRADGKYAASIGGTGMSIPRQVGKTFLVGAIVFALCLLNPKLTVIWTAHRARTAEETFGKMQAFAKRKKIAPHVDRIWLGSGEEEIRFRNGSRILFGARAREFGRGFDEVDVLIFDEAQILGESVLEDMVPATNQSRQPAGALLLFMGTPPRPKDPGEVFTRLRDEALAGEDEDTAWIEFGAEPGFTPTPLPAPLSAADWKQVERANPSFPEDTPREAILRMRKRGGTDASFLREGLGIWDVAITDQAFGAGRWSACRRPRQGVPGALALAASMDLSRWSIVAASSPDENDVIDVAPMQHGPGSGWVVARAKELQDRHEVEFVVDGRGPAAVLIPNLEAAGVRLTIAKTGDVLDACAEIYTRVQERRLGHDDYAELNAAVSGAVKRAVSKRWAWGQGKDVDDVSTLEAATLAAHAAAHPTAVPVSAYSDDHDLIII